MNKQAYLRSLELALQPYDPALRSEIMGDYDAHFDMGRDDGKSEAEIIASLGDVEEVLSFLGEPTNSKQVSSKNIETDNLVTKQPKKVALHGFVADIKVVSSSDNQIKVDYINHGTTKEKLMYSFTGQQIGDAFEIRLEQKEKWSSFFGSLVQKVPPMEIFLQVPKGLTSLTIKSLSGDCLIDSIDVSELRIKSASGAIQITDALCQEVVIDSASGDLEIDRIQGNLSFTVASGDVSIQGHVGDAVGCNSASGDISYVGSATSIDMKSVSGDTKIVLVSDAKVQANSVSGDIHIILAAQSKGISLLQFASVSGDIRCMHPSYPFRGSSLHYETDTNGTDLSIRTVSGDAKVS